MSDSYDSERDVPDFVDEAEAEYVELEDDAYADREPTEDEERAAERGATSAPDVSDPYEEALHRGADIKGEGQILPD